MAIELQDTDSFNGSIAAGASETLVVETQTAEYVELLIDDGTTGGAPATYDYDVDFYSTVEDGYMQASSDTGVTANAPDIPDPRCQKLRVEVTNSSGAGATYRISLESFKKV